MNILPKVPTKSPRPASHPSISRGIGSRYPRENTGLLPKNSPVTAVAVTAAVMDTSSAAAEKVRCSSSKPKITPARGALKAAASPAPAPATSRFRASSPLWKLWLRCPMPCPAQAPSCTLGPSLPRDIPAPMASTPPAIFATNTDAQFIDILPISTPLT